MSVHAFDLSLVRKARQPCPKCGKKGVGYARHPGAADVKDRSRAECRYCRASFKVAGHTEQEGGA